MKRVLGLVLLVVLVAGVSFAQPQTTGRVPSSVTVSWDSTFLFNTWSPSALHTLLITNDGTTDTLLVAWNNDTTSAKIVPVLPGEQLQITPDYVQWVRRKASANTIKSRMIWR
jgi:hypothetical protein